MERPVRKSATRSQATAHHRSGHGAADFFTAVLDLPLSTQGVAGPGDRAAYADWRRAWARDVRPLFFRISSSRLHCRGRDFGAERRDHGGTDWSS